MSEVVPLPSFGEVFFDARGQERCLRVTWHEGTLVLSLWRGEMCTASFRMPMDDVGRLLDTLDEGYAEATGETAAVPAEDPGTELIPGTGTYHRPSPQDLQPPHQVQPHQAQPQLPDERPTATLSPNDVLVARGTPATHQDKLVASYSETTAPRGTPAPQSPPFTGPQYTGSAEPFTGPQYTGNGYRDPLSGPQYTQPAAPFTGPQYAEEPAPSAGDPVYQLPGEGRAHPLSTDPLGFPSQTRRPEPYQGHGERYQQQGTTTPPGGTGLGTPMHGIPGAGRRQDPFTAQAPFAGQDSYARHDAGYGQDSYTAQNGTAHSGAAYGQDRYPSADYPSADGHTPPNPVDPLLALGRQEEPYRRTEPDRTRSYAEDPLFSTGERLRPEQQYDDRHDRREW